MCGLPASNEKQSRPSELIVLQLTLKICFENICIVFFKFQNKIDQKDGSRFAKQHFVRVEWQFLKQLIKLL